MRKTISVAVLVLAFCCPAAAGIMHNPEPEPPAATAGGIIQTGEPAPTAEDGIIHGDNTDLLTQIVRTLLVSVLP